MDNLNNGFSNPNAPSNGATQNAVNPDGNNINSVYNNPIPQNNPVMDNNVNPVVQPMANPMPQNPVQPDPMTQSPVQPVMPDPMSAPQAPVMDNPMSTPAQPVVNNADSFQSDLDALKALADELNSVQEPVPVQPTMSVPQQPVMDNPMSTPDPIAQTAVQPVMPDPMATPQAPLMDNPVASPDPVITPVQPQGPVIEDTAQSDLDALNALSDELANLQQVESQETPVVDPVIPTTDTATPVEMSTPDPIVESPVQESISTQPETMDINALTANPLDNATPVVEAPVSDIPTPTENPLPSENQMNDDLAALNNMTPQDMSVSETPVMPLETPQAEQVPVMDNPVSAMENSAPEIAPMPSMEAMQPETMDNSTPAFPSAQQDLSQPLPNVQQDVAPVLTETPESNEVVNTLGGDKDDDKESPILIILLVVLIVALLAGIGFFAYKVFVA